MNGMLKTRRLYVALAGLTATYLFVLGMYDKDVTNTGMWIAGIVASVCAGGGIAKWAGSRKA